MKPDTVTNSHTVANHERVRVMGHVKHRSVLNVRLFANSYVVHVAPDYDVVPDA